MNIKCRYDAIVNVGDLIPNSRNNNVHSEDQIKDLALSMESEGILEPIHVSNLSGHIFKGEDRWLAAKLNGYKTYPVCYTDFDSLEDEYIALTADNAIGQRSKIDLAKVNVHIQDLGPFEVERLRITDFSILCPAEELGEKQTSDEQEKKFIIEVQFPNDMEMMDVHDDLLHRGFIVKIK